MKVDGFQPNSLYDLSKYFQIGNSLKKNYDP